MYRLEYTIDGKFWNNVSIDFPDEQSVIDYMQVHELFTFISSARILHVTKVIPVEFGIVSANMIDKHG